MDNPKGTTAVAFDKLHDRYGDLLVEHGYAVKALRTILNVIRMSDTHEGLPEHLIGEDQNDIDRHALDVIEGIALTALPEWKPAE